MNEGHTCKHEVDLALMQQDIRGIAKNITTLTNKLSNGLTTKVELHDERIRKLSQMQWYILIVLVGAVLGNILSRWVP